MRRTNRDVVQNVPGVIALAGFLLVAVISVRASADVDFHAFYCGGVVVNAGRDPYRVEPLRTCEHGGSVHSPPLASGSVVPVPVPEYDLAAFRLFAQLPYQKALMLWEVLLWGFVGITIVAVQRLTAMSPAVITAAFLFSDGFLSSFQGQIVPFSIAGLALAALCASRRRHALAALSLPLVMCEPHIGLGALLALALLAPSSRWGVALCAGLLCLLTYAATGGAWTIEYVHDVLGRHISSEVMHDEQYSLTWLSRLLDAPERIAISLGELSYLITLAAGIAVAACLYRKRQDGVFLVTIPPAFALIGGPYIHISQMAAALPAALHLYARMPTLRRPLGWAILLLAVPWIAFSELQTVLPFLVLGIGLLAWTFIEDRRIALGTTVGSIALLVAAAATFHFNIPITRITVSPSAFSEDAWRLAVNALFSQHTAFFFPLKVPTWCGLLIIAWAAIKAAVTPKPKLYEKST
jgi:hypothetical protein